VLWSTRKQNKQLFLVYMPQLYRDMIILLNQIRPKNGMYRMPTQEFQKIPGYFTLRNRINRTQCRLKERQETRALTPDQ